MKPLKVDNSDHIFGTHTSRLMPNMDDVPKEFKGFHANTKQNEIVSKWFFSGLPEGTKFIPKEGIDKNIALRHIGTILRSFEPKHEDKVAACAYLFSLWFDDIIIPGQ